eukprot:138151-Prymnesium_polylepis.1
MKCSRVCPEDSVRGNASRLTLNKALGPTLGSSDGRSKQMLRNEGFIFVNKMSALPHSVRFIITLKVLMPSCMLRHSPVS